MLDLTLKKMRNLTCEICNKQFTCNSDKKTGCWCQHLPIKKINKNLLDCICHTCLSKMENED